MLQNLTRNNQTANLTQIKNMMNTLKGINNPSAMLNQYASSNPQLKQAINLVNNSGGDPKKCFYQLAEQMGVNPNDVLSALK